MPVWQQFTLDSFQTAIFTPDCSVFAAGRVVATILRRFGETFDGEMQALPLPSDVPPEVPRVVLQSSDGQYRLHAAPARIDSFWSAVAAKPGATLDLVKHCAEVHEHYVRETGVRVARLGFILRRIYPIENPAQALIERFCNAASQQATFHRSAAFEIHNHKQYVPRRGGIDFEINSWVRCKSALASPDNRPVILVEQDLNTRREDLDRARFEAGQIGDFFAAAVQEADDVLDKYFPEQEGSCR